MKREFKVHFMIVGAQKSGTTTLFHILQSHPLLIGSKPKEPHYFSRVSDWKSQIKEYESMFPKIQKGLLYEASTTYTFFPHMNTRVWDDIYEFNPDMKIIYIVREPIERMISGYMHSYERGYIDISFENAIIEKPEFLNVTRYATQITPYIERFGRKNVYICFFEDLVKDQQLFMRQVSEFLNIAPDCFSEIEFVHRNKSIGGGKKHVRFDKLNISKRLIRKIAPKLWERLTDNSDRSFKSKPVVTSDQREMILHLLRAEINEMESLTGRDLNSWRDIKSQILK